MSKYILFLATLLTISSCQTDQSSRSSQPRKDDFSSPKALFVDYVSSYTGGVVSKASSIRVRFAKSMMDSLTATQLNKVFSFSPEIAGTTSATDDKTLVFTPSEPLQSNKKYEATANLEEILEGVDSGKKNFKFVFQTLVQNYDVTVGGLKLYDKKNVSRVKIEGTLQTADVAEFASVQKMISAKQSSNELEITWDNTGKDNVFGFTIEDVTRSESASSVGLSINGAPLNVDKLQEMDVEVPALDDYKVISSKVVRSGENYISVLFSDLLNDRQNLTGLVTLSNTSNRPRLVVNLNELKVYPTQEMSSSAELIVNQAIQNIAGYKLKEDYRTTLQFSQIKPEVRLLSESRRAVLPNSKGLVLPFEAVGLKAVDVTVVRIFDENVLQYLQVNDMGEEAELRRVGRPISKRVIPLNTSGVTNLNAWNRFTLNLEDIFSAEPGAIYQIGIGFRKRHSLYFCSGSEEIESLNEDLEEDWGAQEESSYWDSYESYYSPGYNWQDRDNPCSDSYYGARRNVSKMLMASNFGLIAKRRDKGDVSVFVSNLLNTEPMSGVSIELYDYQQQLVGSTTTDSDGKASVSPGTTPFALIARKGDQTGYLKLDDGSSLSLSNFDVGGTRVKNGIKGHIYGERGVWRPADTVHLGFILADIQQALPDQHPVVMELYNPAGQLAFRKVRSEPVGSIYRFDFLTDAEAPTGNWQAKAKVGGAEFTKTIKIETIKPNRLKIDLQFNKDVFDARDVSVTGDLNVRWLTGATASNLRAEYELKFRPVKTTFDGYPNYSFDDQAKDFYSTRELVFDGRVNSEGYARVNFSLGGVEDAPGALKAMLYGKVYEEGGDFSVGNKSIAYYPYSKFVGLKTPEGDKRGILLTDKDHTVQIASVDAGGNPVSRKGLNVRLYKLDWKWWWDNSYEYIGNYVGRSYRSPIIESTVSTTNGKGTWTLRLDYPQWGRYYLQVEDPVSGHAAGKIIYMDWPGWAGGGKRGDLGGAAMLDFAVEKDEYAVGDQIAMSIPSTAGNRVLVSLESGSEVLQTFWVETKEEATAIAFEATANMAPNVYAHLSMVQPHAQTNNDLPIRLYGVQSIKVIDPTTVLKPQIELPEELSPGQKYTVEVSEKNAKAMAYTIAIVDEGLLDITNFKTPDPWSGFYSREALGIKTWDVYDDVIGAFGGSMDRLLAVGGDEDLGDDKDKKDNNRFKPVVQFLGPFYLEQGDKNSHKVQMPQYIGSVKTMVVAASDRAYGSTDRVTPVRQPMMVMATLPRVVGPAESMKLPVNVFALEDNIGKIQVTVETSGTLETVGAKSKTVQLAKSGDKVVYFDIKARETLGEGKVRVTAKSANLDATYDVTLNTIPRNPMMTDVTDRVIDASNNWALTYDPLGMLGENSAYVELSSLPPLNIQQRLDYLVRYPHGCIEQTTSAVFAQLFLHRLMSLDEDKSQEIQRNVEAGINRLKLFQLGSGGFSYWPGNAYANNWGSNYAGHFMIEAKKAGYVVPEGMISTWIGFQSDKANSWGVASTDEDNDLIQAYRLYTLALADSPALGAMNRMKEAENVGIQAKWRLALAYAVAGYKNEAVNLIEGLSDINTTTWNNTRGTFGSQLRDQAMILETLLTLDSKERAFELLMELAGKMGDKEKWMSTQTTAYCFIAIAKYAATFGVDNDTDVNVTIGEESFARNGSDFVHQVTLKEPNRKQEINIQNQGAAPVFARLIRTGIPLEGNEQIIERNVNFSVRYTDMNGIPVDVSGLNQGTNFKAEVNVTNPGLKGNYSEIALTQIFPSGWEIINTRLDGSQDDNQKADYIDIRDDRTMHYFDLEPNEKASFTVLLNAAYQGRYYLPSVTVGAMYDNTIFANKTGQWVMVKAQ